MAVTYGARSGEFWEIERIDGYVQNRVVRRSRLVYGVESCKIVFLSRAAVTGLRVTRVVRVPDQVAQRLPGPG